MTTPEYELLATRPRPAHSAIPNNIPIVDEASATGDVAAAYQEFRDRFGRPDVPGILKCFSSSPALLRPIMDMSSVLLFSDGALGRRIKEMLATYVSSLNQCPYCQDSHGFFLRVHGGTDALLNAIASGNLDDPSISAAERILLDFARRITCESFKISERDVEPLRTSGWNEDQIAECVHIAASFAFFNRVANAFGLPSQNLLSFASELQQQETR